MAYHTLSTHLIGPNLNAAQLTAATAFAEAFNAHLDIFCHGVEAMTVGFHPAGLDITALQQALSAAQDDLSRLEADTRAALEHATCRWSLETTINPMNTLAMHGAGLSRFSDLVVQTNLYGESAGDSENALVEGILLEGATPVLILPEADKLPTHPGTVIVAWNESPEALAAVKSALPLLRQAQLVRITVIEPPRHSVAQADPGGPISVFLARHGVRCEIDVLGRSLPRVSDVLMRHAADKSADLVVMGAYGKSRFREALLGGATRDMLQEAKIPVLMRH